MSKSPEEINKEFYKEQELRQIEHDLQNPLLNKKKEQSLALWGMFIGGSILGLFIGLVIGSMH